MQYSKKRLDELAKIAEKHGTFESVSDKKPPREIIDHTLSGIIDQTDKALADFKKMIERNKQLEHVKKLKNGDFDNMI